MFTNKHLTLKRSMLLQHARGSHTEGGQKVKMSHTASEETAQHPVRHVHFMGHVLSTHTTAHSFTIHLQAQLHVHFMGHVLSTHTTAHSFTIHLQAQLHVHFMGHVLFTHTTAHSFTIHLQAQLHVHFMCHVLFTRTRVSFTCNSSSDTNNCCYIGYVHFVDHVLSTHTRSSHSVTSFSSMFAVTIQYGTQRKRRLSVIFFKTFDTQ